MNAMRLRSQRQSTIMSRHHQFFASTVAPEQGASQMNCVIQFGVRELRAEP